MQNLEYTFKVKIKALLFCFLLWLLFPIPLLFIARPPIKDFWSRLFLVLFSPMVILLGIEGYNYLERRYKYSQKEIERIIGIELPALENVEYEEKELNTHLLRGHKITKKLEFVQIPQEDFYNRLDSLCCLSTNEWTTEEYTSILDSLIKSKGMIWDEYLISDKQQEMDSIAKQIMVVNNIQPIHYKFSCDIKLHIEKGSKYATLEYSDWEFQESFLSH